VAGPQLLAFQIGNEPDGFGRWSGVRPKTYDTAAFLNEWQRFQAAMRAAVPAARFAGPDVAGTGWIAPFADAAPAGVVMLTRHYYAGGPASNPAVTLRKLMRSGALRLAVINKDVRTASVRIEPGRRFAKGEASRLVAPALDATSGVRFGGAAIDGYGGWVPAAHEGAQFDGGAIVLDMPGASAALVTLQVG
jgi:hypothetical protein